MARASRLPPWAARIGTPNFFRVLALALSCSPDTAMAIQTHGEPEGIVVHQLAHVFFFLAMAGMVLRIHFSPLAQRRSWRLLSRAAVILAAWNLWAFIGHQLELLVPAAKLIFGPQREPLLTVDSWVMILFYISKMDHCILVPAMIYFYLGLRHLITENTL